MPDLYDLLEDAITAQPPAAPPPLEDLLRRARRQRHVTVAAVAVVVTGVAVLIPVVVAETSSSSSAPSQLRTITSASPTPVLSVSDRRRSAAQAVLGPKYSLVSSRQSEPGWRPRLGSLTIEEWKAGNGDQAQITWQLDNATLDHAAPPTKHTAAGDQYEIQHDPNGSEEIVMYSKGNAVLYTRIDPNVNPNDIRDGVLVSDVPSDRTLVRQAARLLAAS